MRPSCQADEFGDADRHTADEYAAMRDETVDAIESRYAATGDFNCGAKIRQANVKQAVRIIEIVLQNKKPRVLNPWLFPKC